MSELILKNAQIVLPDEIISGSLVIEDGKISSIDEGNTELASAIDCNGDFIIPGLIELHTDNLERHVMPRPKTYWPADAAILNHDRELASVGITTVLNAICIGDVNTNSVRVMMVDDLCHGVIKHTKAQTLKADHYIHLRCEVSYGRLIELLDPLIVLERVRLLSVMDHTPGQRQFVDVELYANYYQGKFGLSDKELEEFMSARRADQEKYSDNNRNAVVERAKQHQITLASHDDATSEHVEQAIKEQISIAEFPTTLEAAKASHDANIAVMMGGPNIVRGKSHSGNISARELAGHEILDIISSDYVPSSLLFAAMILSEKVEGISLPQAINMITKTPAESIGLNDRGVIAIGKRADLVRFRPYESAPIILDVWKAGEKIA